MLIEWPKGEAEPAKYWLANLPAEMPLARLVPIAKMRWRIERDYRELKQEFGLSHYEERGWRGFHHHATLCIAAYGYLMAGALAMETPKKNGAQPQTSALPADYVPRGSGSRTAACAGLDPDIALPHPHAPSPRNSRDVRAAAWPGGIYDTVKLE